MAAAAIIETSVVGPDPHDADENQSLRDRGQRVTDIQRAGDGLVGDDATELERCGGRRERADAERVEKIRDEADGQVQHARLCRRRTGSSPAPSETSAMRRLLPARRGRRAGCVR